MEKNTYFTLICLGYSKQISACRNQIFFGALNNKVLTCIHDKGNRHSKGNFSSETWETEGKKSQEENRKILRVHRKKLYGPECKRLLNYNC